MKILSIQAFEGSNIYSLRPVVKSIIDVEDLHDTPTKDIGNFNKILLESFPGLIKHKCCLEHEGGFVERLIEGTYLPHVTEHIVIEMQNMLGYDVSFGKARVTDEYNKYVVVFEYKNEVVAVECIRRVVDTLNKIIIGKCPDINKCIGELRQIAAITDLGPSTSSIFSEAKKRQIPVRRIGIGSLLQLGYGKNLRYIQASMTDSPSCLEVDMSGDKQLTKKLLSKNSIPVPFGYACYSAGSAIFAAEEIGYPVVVKPLDSNQGKGVSICLSNPNEVNEASVRAFKFSKGIIVEKYYEGNDYRVLVIGGKVAAVAMRCPPRVIGDGIHSIKELIDIENTNSLRGDDHEKPLTKLKLDDIMKEVLCKQGVDENYIPAENKEIVLRENANLSTGGTSIDCTDIIHQFNKEVAIAAAKCLKLDIAGIDITAKDISVPIDGKNGAIIEVNAAPGLRMHLHPSEGVSRNVAGSILDMVYPDKSKCTIPIISVTGTNGKTTTTRMISHILGLSGKIVGMTTTNGTYIGDECILKGDNAGPNGASIILSDRRVEAAVLESARGGIVKKGLGYDAADIGIITNISEDHLGLDNINTIEELAFIKSLVIEGVKKDGYCILNADDKMISYFMNRAKADIILFSQKSNNQYIEKHLENGGKGVTLQNNMLVLRHGEKSIPIIDVRMIPITFGGHAKCNIENSLAAVAALYGLGIKIDVIKKGLISFMPDNVNNPGRFNSFELQDFKVMLDYGHNPAGYRAVAEYIKNIKCSRLIGVVGVPGDRQDELAKEVGKICAETFDYIYIKEDMDLRGRDASEIANIIYESLIKEGFDPKNIEIIYSETKALEMAMNNAKKDDFIVVFYENYEGVLSVVNDRINQERNIDKEIETA